jgi:hypothetical protein
VQVQPLEPFPPLLHPLGTNYQKTNRYLVLQMLLEVLVPLVLRPRITTHISFMVSERISSKQLEVVQRANVPEHFVTLVRVRPHVTKGSVPLGAVRVGVETTCCLKYRLCFPVRSVDQSNIIVEDHRRHCLCRERFPVRDTRMVRVARTGKINPRIAYLSAQRPRIFSSTRHGIAKIRVAENKRRL